MVFNEFTVDYSAPSLLKEKEWRKTATYPFVFAPAPQSWIKIEVLWPEFPNSKQKSAKIYVQEFSDKNKKKTTHSAQSVQYIEN